MSQVAFIVEARKEEMMALLGKWRFTDAGITAVLEYCVITEREGNPDYIAIFFEDQDIEWDLRLSWPAALMRIFNAVRNLHDEDPDNELFAAGNFVRVDNNYVEEEDHFGEDWYDFGFQATTYIQYDDNRASYFRAENDIRRVRRPGQGEGSQLDQIKSVRARLVGVHLQRRSRVWRKAGYRHWHEVKREKLRNRHQLSA